MVWRAPAAAWAVFALGSTGIFLAATLPDLGRYPPVHADETWIMSAAYKLATTGVFGSDMFAGMSGADQHYFIALPVQHVLQAFSFRLLGAGIAQARLVSVVGAVVVLWSASWLALRWYGLLASILTGVLLLTLRVNLVDLWPGLPLMSVGRSGRYDMTAVAFFWLAIVFLDLTIARSPDGRRWPAYATGVCAGLATLTQFFGAFSIGVITLMLVRRAAGRAPVMATAVRIAAGWAAVVLPYVAYVAIYWTDFRGQSTLKEGRTDFLDPRFYLDNLGDEPARYQHLLQPDHVFGAGVATWLFVLAILPALAWLTSRVTTRDWTGDRLLLTALVVCAAGLALFDSTNVPLYSIVLWPGCCIVIGASCAKGIEWTRRSIAMDRSRRRRIVTATMAGGVLLVAFAIVADAVDAYRGDRQVSRTVTGYEDVSRRLDVLLPVEGGVVGHERWWWGLRDRRYLALTVLQQEWERRQGRPYPASFASLFAATGASALLIDDNARSEIARYPVGLRGQIEVFLATNARPPIVLTDPTYGRFEIYVLERDGQPERSRAPSGGGRSSRRWPRRCEKCERRCAKFPEVTQDSGHDVRRWVASARHRSASSARRCRQRYLISRTAESNVNDAIVSPSTSRTVMASDAPRGTIDAPSYGSLGNQRPGPATHAADTNANSGTSSHATSSQLSSIRQPARIQTRLAVASAIMTAGMVR